MPSYMEHLKNHTVLIVNVAKFLKNKQTRQKVQEFGVAPSDEIGSKYCFKINVTNNIIVISTFLQLYHPLDSFCYEGISNSLKMN